ncbi:hypothetical protein BIV57_07925 [Mangrovactinospora gilvigrisea]|uniref:Uncharacterized protein n=1 Tax=Mangrovactinospora gilvigrisea TaxID=1428644 RepID=A0A1J7CEC6_9ACTN|nr:hypothetical protein BIV57_07925 [Mangrovactinospora gilvigrisea]
MTLRFQPFGTASAKPGAVSVTMRYPVGAAVIVGLGSVEAAGTWTLTVGEACADACAVGGCASKGRVATTAAAAAAATSTPAAANTGPLVS